MAKPLNDKEITALSFMGYGRPGSSPSDSTQRSAYEWLGLHDPRNGTWREDTRLVGNAEATVRAQRPDLTGSIADPKGSLDQVPEVQVRVFVDHANQRVVIAGQGSVFPNIPGSNRTSNWGSDLQNSGASEYSKFEPLANQVLSQVRAQYPGYEPIMAGHSLAGGHGQTFALRNGLSCGVLDALPIAPDSIRDQYGSMEAFQRQVADWRAAGNSCGAVYVEGEIANSFYREYKGEYYLPNNFTVLPSGATGTTEAIRDGMDYVTSPNMVLSPGTTLIKTGALVGPELTQGGLLHVSGQAWARMLDLPLDREGRAIIDPVQMEKINASIAATGESPGMIQSRIAPVGQVNIAPPAEDSFNPLPSYPDHPALPPTYVIQPGDTVWGIAQKLGLEPAYYERFLRNHYGPDVDLNDIQADRRLPVPPEAAGQLRDLPGPDANGHLEEAPDGYTSDDYRWDQEGTSTPALDENGMPLPDIRGAVYTPTSDQYYEQFLNAFADQATRDVAGGGFAAHGELYAANAYADTQNDGTNRGAIPLQITFTSDQLSTIQQYREAGDYAGAYRYISSQIQNDPNVDDGTIYWFQQASSINAGESTPANTFIRATTECGLSVDGRDASMERIQQISNEIGRTVLSDITEHGGIPPLSTLARNDINAAITEGGQTIGGWGGSFYFWDLPFGENGETVGELITANPQEMYKFEYCFEQARSAVWNEHGWNAVDDVFSAVNSNALAAYWTMLTQDGVDSPANIERRIQPVGEVHIAPDGDTSSGESAPATAVDRFDPLPSYRGGNPTYTVQAGDTVWDIAGELGMEPTVYMNFLRSLYGPDADLDDIQIGRHLPVPPDVAERMRAQEPTDSAGEGEHEDNDANYHLPGEYVENDADNNAGAGAEVETPYDYVFTDEATGPVGRGPSRAEVSADLAVEAAARDDDAARTSAWNDYYNNPAARGMQSALDLAAQIDGGADAFTIAGSALRTLSSYFESQDDSATAQDLNMGATAVGAFGSALALSEALRSGNDLAAIGAGANLASQAAQLWANATRQGSLEAYRSGEISQSDYQNSLQSTNDTSATVGAAAAGVGAAASLYAALKADDDVAAVGAAANLTHQVTRLVSGMDSGAAGTTGEWAGGIGSAIGLYNALQAGDTGDAIVSGIGLANTLTGGVVNNAIAAAAENALGLSAGQAVPFVGAALSLIQGDMTGAIISVVAYFVPVIGWLYAAYTLITSLFSDDEPDEVKGTAQAGWDADGNIVASITQNEHDGGGSAQSMMTKLIDALEGYLDGMVDAQGEPQYALVPQRLPTVSFYSQYYAEFILDYVDADPASPNYGQSISRHYDDAGNRVGLDGEIESSFAEDFLSQAMHSAAIVPAWEAETILAHLNAGDADAWRAPEEGAGLPRELEDGLTQVFSVLTLDLGEAGFAGTLGRAGVRRFDVDADGFLEQTDWVGANQAILAIDADMNGAIGGGEFLTLDEAAATGRARNSMQWLDANGDGVLNAADPAFGFIKLWLDINGDAVSETHELLSTQDAGIAAIDFSSGQAVLVWDDGTRAELTEQMLTADVRGIRDSAVVGGILREQEDDVTELLAARTHDYSGEEGHTHGGDAASSGGEMFLDAGDRRIHSTTDRTGDDTRTAARVEAAAVTAGAAGVVLAGQAAGATARHVDNVADGEAIESEPDTAASPIHIQAGDGRVTSDVDPPAPATSGRNAEIFIRSGDARVRSLAAAPPPTVQQELRAVTASQIRHADSIFTADGALLTAAALGASASISAHATSPGAALPIDQTPSGSPLAAASVDAPTLDLSTFSFAPVADEPAAEPAGATPAGRGARGTTDFSAVAGERYVIGLPTSPVPREETLDPRPNESVAPPVLLVPEVGGELIDGTEDIGLLIDPALLLANDSTPNAGATLSVTAVGNAVNGSVGFTTDGMIRFMPNANHHGVAQFTYIVTDAFGLAAPGTVRLDLAPVNDLPVVVDESVDSDEDAVLTIAQSALLANDSDVDSATMGDVLRIVGVANATHGAVALNANDDVVFTPDANYFGPASFNYTVSDGAGGLVIGTAQLNIAPINDLPVVTGETVAGVEDTALLIDQAALLANDTDVDSATVGDVLSIVAVGDAIQGSVSLLPDGRIHFVPALNFFGTAQFAYTVSDGAGGLVQGIATIDLSPVNDAPVVTGELVDANEDEALTFAPATLLANDSDVDNPHANLSIVSVGNATNGTVAIDVNGNVLFTPNADYFGPAGFDYTVADGAGGETTARVDIDLAAVNDAPRLTGEVIAGIEDTAALIDQALLLANDTDVDNAHTDLSITAVGAATGGAVELLPGGTIRFTPTLNFSGAASFSYTVTDGAGGFSQAIATIDVAAINDAPTVNDELIEGKRGVTLRLTAAALLANDSDVDNPPSDLRITSVGSAAHGSVTLNADGTITFVPEPGYGGVGTFTYTVSDGQAETAGTANIDLSRINQNPVAVDDGFIGYEDVVLRIVPAQLLANDSDSDNAPTDLRISAVNGAVNGSVSLDGNGDILFTPNAEFSGQAQFTYTVADGDGGQTQATAFVTVNAVNDAPVIEAIEYGRPIFGYQQVQYWNEDTWSWETTLNQIGDEGTAVTLAAQNQLRNGNGQVITPSYYMNGHLRPIAFDNVDATDTYTDGESGNTTSTSIDDPLRQNGRIIAYDVDSDISGLTYSISGGPAHGHTAANVYVPSSAPSNISPDSASQYWIGETGAWQYFSHPGDGYSGSDPFTVAVTDAGGATGTATVSAYHQGTGQSGGKKPVTLDLDGNGLQFLDLDDSNVYFDVNGDGWREHIAWAAPGDGLLVLDTEGDRRIDRPEEISFTGYLPDAHSDLDGLRAFDTNGDGRLSALDERWGDFAVWQDANSNGLSEDGEVLSLDDVGIAELSLQSDGRIEFLGDVTLLGRSTFTRADGTQGEVGDAVFAVREDEQLPPGDALTTAPVGGEISIMPVGGEDMADVRRHALAFVEAMAAFEADPDAAPLASVELPLSGAGLAAPPVEDFVGMPA